MAPSVPPSLKKIKVFLTRAEELDRDKGNAESRVVAYNCRQYAVLSGIPLAGQDAAAKNCLGELLGQLEKEKAAMAVFSKSEHWKISRKVADRVFEKADAEDRAGVANKGTAKTFYAAGTFYEILQQFYDEKEGGENAVDENEVDETKVTKDEEVERRIYCKWKATDILNAVKEGRTPTPGGYQQEEMEDMALPLVGPPEDVSNGMYDLPSIGEELPPAPSMPSSDFFGDGGHYETNEQSETNDNISNDMAPPSYDGFELNINGDPTPTTVEEVNEGDEDSGTEEIFIPGAVTNAAENIGDVFVDMPSPVAPPPPYPDHAARSYDTIPSIPPPVETRPLPPPTAAPSPNKNTGVFSSLFGNPSSNSKKLSKAQMADAVELTKFALAALQKGDGDLGRERLEQALGIWRSTSNKNSGTTVSSLFGKLSHSTKSKPSKKQMADVVELTKFALSALYKGDGGLGKERLEQALGVWRR
eukprot:CAMPEP_0201952950 /NCGR_PEP_ID=MMETSP0904-20121228/1516_1 /ASSEMBLY_ACC=CAM_ASM_000553 /TAXON_ID=420261 /ORGANISM="Thalassiosira antarctica, Strain CCMP982" /LENGTH=473 /DNA_ID=CAMNT_0048496747 /DNA_START=44 /DNA_END=1465 /DNA_ORIENTATION=+